MDKKAGSRGGNGSPSVGQFVAAGHQSAAVGVREGKLSDDRRKIRSNPECKAFPGEAIRRRKTSKDSKTPPCISETTEKYLQDSYKQAFQKHVDNLTNVISQQHRGEDRGKREVQIRPNHPQEGPIKPLSRLEIKSDAGLNQVVTFGSDDDELESSTGKMNPVGGINVLTEKLQEENFFEELIEPNPMITFNHVCTEETTDHRLGYHLIKKTNSRSPSPMLEVPDAKRREKMTMRPPL